MKIAVLFVVSAIGVVALQTPPQFGGSYASLDQRQQHFIDDWVARFTAVTGRKAAPAEFYDQIVRFSTKTTFEAITHALKTTPLTDSRSGQPLGDALDVIERVDTVRGKVVGAAGDRQFRMYVRLKEGGLTRLARSREFTRRADNTVYHKGYPINFRGASAAPSIQVSIALDHRHADIDVDYRASSFPAALFNGHLTSANSDVRAGNNYAKHTGQWSGLQNWWQSVFGIKLSGGNEPSDVDKVDPRTPRIGKKPIEAMTKDFLEAWLIEGDIAAAMSYVSRRALACMVEESDPAADQGMLPVMLARRLKLAHDAVGVHRSLDGLVVGVRLTRPGLTPIRQPYGGQFVIYSVPGEQARAFECGGAADTDDNGGKYFGSTFYVTGTGAPTPVALLWAQDDGYWRIVAWQTDADDANETPEAAAPAVAAPERITADPSLVDAATGFLESWLIRKDYAKAFTYLSADAYGCYDVIRGADQPAAASADDAAQRIRAALEQVGSNVGKVRSLDDILSGIPPVHPATRVMTHRRERAVALMSLPDALTDAASCAARARGELFTGDVPPEYGRGFAAAVRFKSAGAEAPVLRLLWMKTNGEWRITAYDVDLP